MKTYIRVRFFEHLDLNSRVTVPIFIGAKIFPKKCYKVK
jgi:hypothetical protein